MKNLFLFLAFGFLHSFSFGQIIIQHINLNKYKNPDYKYNALNISFKFAGKGNYNLDDKYIHNKNVKEETGDFNVYLRFSLSKSTYINSRKNQIHRSLSFSLAPEYIVNYDFEKETYSRLNVLNYLYYNSENKHFITKKLFLESDIKTLTKSRFNINSTNIYKSSLLYSTTLFPLLIGYGRIEVVSNAWRAYRIIKDLNKYNLLTTDKEISQEDIFEMADYINKRAYTREYDSREHFKNTMVGFTKNYLKNIAKTDDPLYYASLYDMWKYSVNAVRLSGSAISFGLIPQINYDYFSNDDNNFNINVFKFSLLTTLKYEYHKALNVNWQFDITSQLTGGVKDLYYSINGEKQEDEEKFAFIPSFSIGLGFFPNTRTDIISRFRIGADLLQPAFDDSIVDANVKFSWQNSLHYYISPKIRMYGYFNLGEPNVYYSYHTSENFDKTFFKFNGEFGTGIGISIY